MRRDRREENGREWPLREGAIGKLGPEDRIIYLRILRILRILRHLRNELYYITDNDGHVF